MSRSYDAAARVLEAARSGLEDAGRPVPGRVCVQPGSDPAWDCEQLTVAVTRPAVSGTPGRESVTAHPRPWPTVCELRVELVRCVPVGADDGSPPTVVEWQTAAAELLDDADALVDALTPAKLTGRPGAPAAVQPVQTFGPTGGLASVALVVSVPL